MKKTKKVRLSAQRVSEDIHVPLEDWGEKCCFVCAKMIRGKVVEGNIVRGVYSSGEGGGFKKTTHCWIKRDDGTIVDPTFWTLENKKPSIYCGKRDERYLGGDEIPLPLDIHWSF